MKIFKRKRFTAEEVIKKCGFRIILVFFQFSFFIFGEIRDELFDTIDSLVEEGEKRFIY